MTKNQMLKIIKAIKTGDLGYVTKLFHEKNDWLFIPLVGEHGYKLLPIHHASKERQFEILRLFLEKEPDLVNSTDDFGRTPIHFAIMNEHLRMVDFLVNRGADLTLAIDAPDHACHGYFPIHWAAKHGYYEIVECLIDHGADINMRVGEMQYHLIHIASQEGHLNVVKILLNQDPELVDITDVYGQTPVLWAAANGHLDVVTYFISENANLNLATNRPDHADHGKTPLMRAMEGKYFAMALQIIANQSKSAILPVVQSGAQALELMMLDPTLTDIFLRDDRVLNLIKKTRGCNITTQSIDWYKQAGRRPSWFVEFDSVTGRSSVFKPVKNLGKGSYGTVRLFQNAENQKIGVKSLKETIVDISPTEYESQTRKLKREAEFNQLAYPNDQMSKTFELYYKNHHGHRFYSNRYVMPYIKGVVVESLIPTITCSYQLAKISLQIAQELHRIHNLGIIHGDLHPSNIMMYRNDATVISNPAKGPSSQAPRDDGQGVTIYPNHEKFIIRIIDFGCSSFLTDLSARIVSFHGATKWYAPELVGVSRLIKPNQNQDVYSLGFSLNMLFSRHSSYQELMQLFPCIGVFILEAQNINPMNRPSLESFCAQLSNEIHARTENRPFQVTFGSGN